MADTKISALPAATANTAAEIPVNEAGTTKKVSMTAAGATVLEAADATAQRTALGLGTAATQSTSAFDAAGAAATAQAAAIAASCQRSSNLSDVATPATALNNILPTQASQGGKYLKTDGTNATWQAGGGGGGDMLAANNLSDVANKATSRANLNIDKYSLQSTGYSILATDNEIGANNAGGAVSFTLPAANAVNAGQRIRVSDKLGNAGTNNITIARAGADTINGATTSQVISSNFGAIQFISDGVSNWFVQVITSSGLQASNNLSDVANKTTSLTNLVNGAGRTVAASLLSLIFGGATVAKSANFSVTSADAGKVFEVTTAANTIAVTFPTLASGDDGFVFSVIKSDVSAGVVTDAGAGTGMRLNLQNEMQTYRWDGAGWSLVTSQDPAAKYSSLFGTGIDGDVTISSNITMAKDGHYRRLTMSAGGTLSTTNFSVFCSELLDLTNAITNSIRVQTQANGGAGGNGTNAAGGAAGGATSSIVSRNGMPGPGIWAVAGAGGFNAVGAQTATVVNASLYFCGGQPNSAPGGADGGGNAGGAMRAGTFPTTSLFNRNLTPGVGWGVSAALGTVSISITFGSMGGSGGGGDASAGGGGGGAAGMGGSWLHVAARKIVTASSTKTAAIRTAGWNGGAGGNGYASAGNAGGGGGGGGGNGGYVNIVYFEKVGVQQYGIIDLSGGNGGAGGLGNGTGFSGYAGAQGYPGIGQVWDLKAGTVRDIGIPSSRLWTTPWFANSAVSTNQNCVVGLNRYTAATAGTSAVLGSGGPSAGPGGTGAGITDGTAAWTYFLPPEYPAWAASTYYPAGAVVSKGTQIYKNMTAGTSGATGPTTVAYGISDGGCSWDCTGTTTTTARADTTAYTVGQHVTIGRNVVVCLTAGTTTTGAPTVTQGTITDGTVVWGWVGTITQEWRPSAVYAVGETVVNLGYVFQATVGGTSTTGTGPTAAGSDGTVTWALINTGGVIPPAAAAASQAFAGAPSFWSL